MKNQYFGDDRDLFKYDLAWEIMKAGLAERFTFIPMLTAPDATRQGDNRSRTGAGHKNCGLAEFLNSCKQDIKELPSFFKKYGVEMTIYGGGSDFSHDKRKAYFVGIGDELLTSSLILVDPDNGLEVGRSREKHLLYAEVKALYDRMTDTSILMLYQHFPHIRHQKYWETRMEELKKRVSGDYPVSIDNNEIVFFFLTKNGTPEQSLVRLLDKYRDLNGKWCPRREMSATNFVI